MKENIISGIIAIVLTTMLLAAFFLSGCNTAGKAIDSASQKSLVGSGFLAINKITVVDSTTNSYTPQIFSLWVTGQYISILDKANFLWYNKKSSASTFNASAITTEESLVIQIDGKGTSLDKVISELAKMQAESTNTSEISNGSTTESK